MTESFRFDYPIKYTENKHFLFMYVIHIIELGLFGASGDLNVFVYGSMIEVSLV